MQRVKLGDKEVILSPTYLTHKKLNEKYGLANGEALTGERFNEFVIDAIWKAVKRKGVFKPFITRRRMIKQLKPWDIDRMREMIDWVYNGKMFTEEELRSKVEETRKRIAAETERLRKELLSKTEEELADIINGRQESASDGVKKNG